MWGKLVSALSFVMLLLLAAIPLQSIAFFFGGVAETEVETAEVEEAACRVPMPACSIARAPPQVKGRGALARAAGWA